MNYWIVAPFAAIGLIIYAIAAVTGERNGYRHGEERFYDVLLALQEENKRLIFESVYADGLEQENERLNDYADQVVALNADLHDALIDAQEEIKALHRQTIQVEAAPPAARPKRTKKVVEQ